MSPSQESSLLVLVEPHGAVSQAVCEYPENVKHRRRGPARADSAVGHHQDLLDLSTHVVRTGALATAHFGLSLNPGPKDISKGFVFGSDPQTCDILLAKDKIRLAQVFEGLRFLHKNGFVHGSICPGSIRFEGPAWRVKLSDIGLYQYVELDNQEERQLYASQRQGTSPPLPVWDTWSAGVVGLMLLSPNGLPTRKRSQSQRQWATTVANRAVEFRSSHPTTVSNRAAQFLASVLKVEYHERLSAEECLEHPWLKPKRLPTSLYSDESVTAIKEEEESDESTETEEPNQAEEVGGEDTETEEPRSSRSKGKQPVYARRASVGNQHRQPSRTPISKSKQQQQPQRARRTSIDSRHMELVMKREQDNEMRGYKGSRPSK